MKKILAAAACVFGMSAGAADGVDYSKPYDQIVAQAQTFESRHSLMPREDSDAASALPPAEGESAAADAAKAGAEAVTVPDTLPEPAAAAKAEEFPAVAGRDAPRVLAELLEPVVLKPIHLERVDGPSMYAERDGVFVQVPPAPVIDEARGSTIERPLLIGNRKPQLLVPGAMALPNTEISPPAPAVPAPQRPAASESAMAHVASYNTEDGARNGAREVEKKYPRAALFETVVRREYVKDKGYFWRLYFAGDRRELDYLCKDMRGNGEWCMIK
ncbi:MAG: hypothetical protein LBI17_02665 [Rickettsiales bacterium]|jgi:hypothetical protein|nr:hypothetical protein [Rickettsiales bacterium]